jgi:enamine deaminase RidA (YjgF/YER057c/UK114 family)
MERERQLISSGAAFEARVGYSRAVRVGDRVWVSGTAPIMPGDADPPATPYDQAKVCLEIIERALGEAFARARPATTGIVTQLLDPRWLVEIEAEAVILLP